MTRHFAGAGEARASDTAAGARPLDTAAGARVEIWVNTQRARRALIAAFAAGGPRLLPRIRVVTELAADPLAPGDLPPPASALGRKLDLARDYPRESRLFANEILQGAPRMRNAIEGDLRITTCDMWLKAPDRGAVISGPAVVTQPAF